MTNRLGVRINGKRISKLQFISNTAGLYGSDIASPPSNLVLLGKVQSQIVMCQNSQVLYRNFSQGNVTNSRNGSLYSNSDDCPIVIAPLGARTVALEFSTVSIECSSAAQNDSSWDSLWENSSYNGPCDSCEKDFLQIEECSDISCAFTSVLKIVCGNKAASWTGVSYYPSDRIISRTGIMKLSFQSDSTTTSWGFSAKFSTQPVFDASTGLVPAIDTMKYAIVVTDAFQTIVRPDLTSQFLQITLCPLDIPECKHSDSISPPSFAMFDDDFIYHVSSATILWCSNDQKGVVVQLSIPGSNLPKIYQEVSCLPCQPGQARSSPSENTWICKKCDKNQYVVNPNIFQCEDCPKGAKCDGNALRGLLEGSVWVPQNTTGQYILKSCPPVLADLT
jgi:hypothetical protein